MNPIIQTIKESTEEFEKKYWNKWSEVAQHPSANGLKNWIIKSQISSTLRVLEKLLEEVQKDEVNFAASEVLRAYQHGRIEERSRQRQTLEEAIEQLKDLMT